MAELTIQIPDELATRLESLQDRLPQLLVHLFKIDAISSSALPERSNSDVAPLSVYAEVLDFLLKRPTLEEIVAFKVSPDAQRRLQILLEKNREFNLTAEESAELDVYEQLEHLMILLKARAYNSIE
jgi:hypothetical protein